jgi:hypothetical protein
MENLLSALAFAGLIAAQFLSVVLVSTQHCDDPFPGTRNRKKAGVPARWTARHYLRPTNVSMDLFRESKQPLSRPARRVGVLRIPR